MLTPAEIYQNSERLWIGTPDDIDYGAMDKRKVAVGTGCIRYGGELIQISTALSGWSVGLSPLPNGLIEVWFAELLVGHIDPKTSSFVAIRPDRDEAGQTKPEV